MNNLSLNNLSLTPLCAKSATPVPITTLVYSNADGSVTDWAVLSNTGASTTLTTSFGAQKLDLTGDGGSESCTWRYSGGTSPWGRNMKLEFSDSMGGSIIREFWSIGGHLFDKRNSNWYVDGVYKATKAWNGHPSTNDVIIETTELTSTSWNVTVSLDGIGFLDVDVTTTQASNYFERGMSINSGDTGTRVCYIDNIVVTENP